jgi:hypothetical protein
MRLEIADTPVSPQHFVSRYKEARERLMGKPTRINAAGSISVGEVIPLNRGCVGWTFGQYQLVTVKRIEFDTSNITVLDIARAVADFFGLTLNDLQSATRSAKIVHARHIAMHFARQMTPKSLPAIARVFGWRDHTSVLHACRKVERLLKAGDENMRRDVGALRVIFEGE